MDFVSTNFIWFTDYWVPNDSLGLSETSSEKSETWEKGSRMAKSIQIF